MGGFDEGATAPMRRRVVKIGWMCSLAVTVAVPGTASRARCEGPRQKTGSTMRRRRAIFETNSGCLGMGLSRQVGKKFGTTTSRVVRMRMRALALASVYVERPVCVPASARAPAGVSCQVGGHFCSSSWPAAAGPSRIGGANRSFRLRAVLHVCRLRHYDVGTE